MNFSFLDKEKLNTGFGNDISMVKTLDEALEVGGLNWSAEPRKLLYVGADGTSIPIPNMVANVRVEDGRPLGIVSEKYRICQNAEAFDFIENLLMNNSIEPLRAGSFMGGRRVWLHAKITDSYSILGDVVDQYILFVNSHDGSTGIKILFTPIRLACSNAINFAIHKAIRSWSAIHTGSIYDKLENAKQTLLRADTYMTKLKDEVEVLDKLLLTDTQVENIVAELFPASESEKTTMHAEENRSNIIQIFNGKDDLQNMNKSGYRLLNAVSDYVTHSNPYRQTKNYNERLFEKTYNGHPIIDKAYSLIKAAA